MQDDRTRFLAEGQRRRAQPPDPPPGPPAAAEDHHRGVPRRPEVLLGARPDREAEVLPADGPPRADRPDERGLPDLVAPARLLRPQADRAAARGGDQPP